MAETLTPYDPADDLADAEAVAVFVAEAFESGDARYIAHALGVAARSQGMTDVAQKTGLSREHLYRSLSEKGNPTLKNHACSDAGAGTGAWRPARNGPLTDSSDAR